MALFKKNQTIYHVTDNGIEAKIVKSCVDKRLILKTGEVFDFPFYYICEDKKEAEMLIDYN